MTNSQLAPVAVGQPTVFKGRTSWHYVSYHRVGKNVVKVEIVRDGSEQGAEINRRTAAKLYVFRDDTKAFSSEPLASLHRMQMQTPKRVTFEQEEVEAMDFAKDTTTLLNDACAVLGAAYGEF